MTSVEIKPDPQALIRAAKADWDADRARLAREFPEWQMPTWSRAPAWRKRPYLAAQTQRQLMLMDEAANKAGLPIEWAQGPLGLPRRRR